MRDIVRELTIMKVPATNFRVENKIDVIWSSEDVDCHGAIYIPLSLYSSTPARSGSIASSIS